MANPDAALRRLAAAIASDDHPAFSKLLSEDAALAKARFEVTNATRQSAREKFIPELGRYVYRGETALHFAGAAYSSPMLQELIQLGADSRAKNRLGEEPLHSAATGNPDSARWNPVAQADAISALIKAGADPNAVNKLGVAPLHKAVRTRCADAVRTLLAHGADPALKNGRGSDPMLLARFNTGRGGSGSPRAKAQQEKILDLLEGALNRV